MKKVVVIGLGSMGKRRVRLLRKNYPDLVIYGIDAREDRQEEAHRLYSVEICKDIDEAKEFGATCAFISTSPLAHAGIIKDCLERGFHVFTELNVVSDGYAENQALARKMGKVLFLSSTFLYRSEIKHIKQRVAETGGKFVYFYHVGQWLPDWHPWESYKDFFVFDKRTNGVREIMVRELPWLTETFGDITDWHIEMSKISSLGLDYPDVYCMILNHSNNSDNRDMSGTTQGDIHSTHSIETTRGVVLMDVVARKSSINLEVISENLYLTWDGTPTGVKEYNPKTREEKVVHLYDSFEHNENYAKNIVEDAYGNEIKAFFDQVEHGIEPVYNFAKDQHVLDISIGSRHLRNLRAILDDRRETYSIDWITTAPASKTTPEGIRERFSYEDEIDHDYDIIFVTNPTSKHCKTIEKYQWYAKSLFIEKPLFAFPDERLREINQDCLFYVACPVRYKRVIQYVKDHISPEEVLSAMAVCSSYLPEWRKGTDYRNGYSAIKDMGGGVSLDLIHELDYLSYLLGTVKNIHNIRDQVSDLELDSDDVSVYIAKLDKAVVQVYLDYFGRKDIRTLTLFCKEDTVGLDLLGNTVEYMRTGEKIELPEERDDFQKRELRYFLDIIDGKQPNTNDLNRAYQTLKNSFGML